MGLLDKLRALLAEAEQDDTGEIEEIEAGVAEAAEGDEGAEGEQQADEGDEGAEGGEGGGTEGGSEQEVEGTPGDQQEPPEVAELRATIIEQAAMIEEQNNRLAAAGLEPVEAEEVEVEVEVEADDDVEDAVTAFDADYDERKAALAEITKEN